MGRANIDWSRFNKKYKAPSAYVAFGGGEKALAFRRGRLNQSGLPYWEIEDGSMITIEAPGRKERFKTINTTADAHIMNCCKAVKKCITNYKKEHGILESGVYETQYHMAIHTSEYLMKGEREVSLVDISHCFWRIAFNHELIDEKTYEKYKDNREARLTAIGCLNRVKYKSLWQNGKRIEREVIVNPLDWAWRFINYQAYLAVNKVRKSCKNIFAFQTDGVYMPTKYEKKAVDTFKSFDLGCSIKRYTMVGHTRHYIVLKNKETGKYKRAYLGMSMAIRDILPLVDFSKYKPEEIE